MATIRTRVKTVALSIPTLAIGCLLSLNSASATQSASSAISPDSPLGACVKQADSDDLDAWLCVGSRLYESDDAGSLDLVEIVDPSEPSFEPTVPEPTTSEVPPSGAVPPGPSEQPSAPEPSASPRAPLVSPEPAPTPLEESPSPTDVDPAFYSIARPGSIFKAVSGDFYDTWCENGTICRRLKSDYIGETKGNAAYGNRDGAVGSFDIILITNLNGSSARFQAIFDWDSGPKVKFHSALHNLVRTSNNSVRWSETVDGPKGNGAFEISSSDQRDTGLLIAAPSQSASTEFVGRITGYFDTSKTPEMRFAPLNGNKFTCHGKGKRCLMNN